ncbi:GNAT family N-acetyltransferase, partial [Streptococcus pneumoniae]
GHMGLFFYNKIGSIISIVDLPTIDIIEPKYLGAILLSFFCYYAKEIGCNNLTLSVWNDNEGALRFYQRQGMKPQETTMEMIID